MPDPIITNCHIHTFVMGHVPYNFPFRWTRWIRKRPKITAKLAWVAQRTWGVRQEWADWLSRKAQFQAEGSKPCQCQVFDNVIRHYPGTTKFVILPMDMELSGYGPAEIGIEAQHRELFAMSKQPKYEKRMIPFATVHPDRPNALDIIKRAVEDYGFRGLKIYPKLGYAPDHKVLMDQIYPYVVDHGLPVMTHCSRGGMRHRDWSQERADAVTKPQAYSCVLKAFDKMRLCLAHFGGQSDWDDYLKNGYDPDDPTAHNRNWQMGIRKMIGSGAYPNLYTDISYTLFHFARFIPFLRLFLEGDDPDSKLLRSHVLFGSDFYMTRQEAMSEREVCFNLRNSLGEKAFREIAQTNPGKWL